MPLCIKLIETISTKVFLMENILYLKNLTQNEENSKSLCITSAIFLLLLQLRFTCAFTTAFYQNEF